MISKHIITKCYKLKDIISLKTRLILKVNYNSYSFTHLFPHSVYLKVDKTS